LPLAKSFTNTSGTATDGADASTALGSIAVTEYGTENAAHNCAGHSAGSGFLTNGNFIGIALACSQIIIIGNQIDALSIDNGIIASQVFHTGACGKQSHGY
jgi:hypothetical protein